MEGMPNQPPAFPEGELKNPPDKHEGNPPPAENLTVNPNPENKGGNEMPPPPPATEPPIPAAPAPPAEEKKDTTMTA